MHGRNFYNYSQEATVKINDKYNEYQEKLIAIKLLILEQNNSMPASKNNGKLYTLLKTL